MIGCLAVSRVGSRLLKERVRVRRMLHLLQQRCQELVEGFIYGVCMKRTIEDIDGFKIANACLLAYLLTLSVGDTTLLYAES